MSKYVTHMGRVPTTRLVTHIFVKMRGSCTWDTSHDEAGHFYTCQSIIVMYMRHAYNKAGNCPTCAHAYKICVMHMAIIKAGNCPMSGWGRVYQDMSTRRLFAVSRELYPLKANILFGPPPAVHKVPSPHRVRGAHRYLYWVGRLTRQISEQVPIEKNKHKGDPARAGQIPEQTLGCSTTALCQLH